MNKASRRQLEWFVTIFIVVTFTAFAFGQGSELTGGDGKFDPIRIIGWIFISLAALAHFVVKVWELLRGKNLEQLKEALSNYKELSDSRRAQLAESNAKLAQSEAERIRLETENERLAEKILRI
jgi:type VI protein secretion system component VasK